jgi:hypothetical protein
MAEWFDNSYQRSHHVVYVEGKTPGGEFKIWDPFEGTKYEMTLKQFLLLWNGKSLFKK